MIFKRSKRSRLRLLNVSRNCIDLGCENWLITVNLLAASGKAFHVKTALCRAGGNSQRSPRPSEAATTTCVPLSRLNPIATSNSRACVWAEHDVTGVFKGKHAIFN
jgi:hypothetical protein